MRERSDRGRARPLHVLLTGDNQSPSAPNRTLARALAREGVQASFRPDLPMVSGTQWLREVRNADAVIHVEYADPDPYSARQLAIGAALGRTIIRWWVGTDVLNAVQNHSLRKKAALIEDVAALSTVSAPHLADELSGVGLHAEFVPPPLDSDVLSSSSLIPDVPRSVLVYLPTYRLEFYGATVVSQLAPMNPDLAFVIVGDESHHLRHIPNVRSLGWVPDMATIYPEIGCVLRMTEHDAVPRTLVEALLRGRYAIHSWPLAGCWLAKTTEEAHEKLKVFRRTEGPNSEGAAAIAGMYQPTPEARYAEIAKPSHSHHRRRMAGMRIAAALTMRGRLSKMLHQGLSS